jgi:hypothetical protein
MLDVATARIEDDRLAGIFAALPPELRIAPEPSPGNDFLITNLAPELTPGTKAPALVQEYPVPGAEAARNTYWFDL